MTMNNPFLLPPYLITTALAAAKLAGPLADVPWVWIVSPIWIPLAIFGALTLLIRKHVNHQLANADPIILAKLKAKVDALSKANPPPQERHSDYDPR